MGAFRARRVPEMNIDIRLWLLSADALWRLFRVEVVTQAVHLRWMRPWRRFVFQKETASSKTASIWSFEVRLRVSRVDSPHLKPWNQSLCNHRARAGGSMSVWVSQLYFHITPLSSLVQLMTSLATLSDEALELLCQEC
eukprot:4727497-Amphidinium_carterae.1